MIGHPQGASGAAGVVTVGAGVVPQFPAADDQSSPPGPGVDLDVIPNHGRVADVEAALCNCLGFGSKNSALVLGRA